MSSAPGRSVDAEVPAAARRHADLLHGERQRRERGRPLAKARGDFRRARVRAFELRQLAVVVGDEDFAVRVHERVVVPARERLVLLDRHLEALRPLARERARRTHGTCASARARAIQVHREERACELVADHRLEVRRARPRGRRRDDDLAELERRLADEPREAARRRARRPRSARGRQRSRSAVSRHPTCAPRRIATQSSANEMPASFAAIGTSECPVMPGDVLTSRNEYEPSARRMRSSRPQPRAADDVERRERRGRISRSFAAGRPQGQKYFVSSEKYLCVVVVVALRRLDPDRAAARAGRGSTTVSSVAGDEFLDQHEVVVLRRFAVGERELVVVDRRDLGEADRRAFAHRLHDERQPELGDHAHPVGRSR